MLHSQVAARYGIVNNPTEQQIENLRLLCLRVLQPLRDHLKQPVIVSSGFRSKALNKRVKGSATSSHLDGLAADIYVDGVPAERLVDKIRSLHLPFDQLINEFDSWVHVSIAVERAPRKEVLHAVRENKQTVYRRIV